MSFISINERALVPGSSIDLATMFGSRVPDILRARLTKGDVFVDVGAKNGVGSALIAAQAVGATGRVIAFEPQAERFSRLLQNVALNRVANTVCVHAAASDETISATLFHEPPCGPRVSGGHNIRVERVDGLCGKFGYRHIEMVKLDVAGSELLVLRGISKLLGSLAAPKILCQFSKCSRAMFQSHRDVIVTYLANFGYEATQLGHTFITRGLGDLPTVRALYWFSKPGMGELITARCDPK